MVPHPSTSTIHHSRKPAFDPAEIRSRAGQRTPTMITGEVVQTSSEPEQVEEEETQDKR